MNSPPWATRYPGISFPVLHLKPRPKKKKQRNSPKDSKAASGGSRGSEIRFPLSSITLLLYTPRDAPVLDLEEIQETASVSQEALLFTL